MRAFITLLLLFVAATTAIAITNDLELEAERGAMSSKPRTKRYNQYSRAVSTAYENEDSHLMDWLTSRDIDQDIEVADGQNHNNDFEDDTHDNTSRDSLNKRAERSEVQGRSDSSPGNLQDATVPSEHLDLSSEKRDRLKYGKQDAFEQCKVWYQTGQSRARCYWKALRQQRKNHRHKKFQEWSDMWYPPLRGGRPHPHAKHKHGHKKNHKPTDPLMRNLIWSTQKNCMMNHKLKCITY